MTDILTSRKNGQSHEGLFGSPPPVGTVEAERWRYVLKEKESLIRRVRGLSPDLAGGEAYGQVLTLYLNSIYPNNDPHVCAGCGRGVLSDPLLPFGWGDRHVWCHSGCHEGWAAGYRKAGVEALAAMGITKPEERK